MCLNECGCSPKCETCTCKPEGEIQIICTNCRDLFPAELSISLNGSPHCPECGEEGACCFSCREVIHGDAIAATIDGETYCESCCGICENCNDPAPSDDLVTVRHSYYHSTRPTRTYCESCVDDNCFTCQDCDNTFYGDAEYIYDEPRCMRCAESYFFCEECEEYHHIEDGCEYSEGHPDKEDPNYESEIGSPTSRFTIRTVGIEIETGHGAHQRDFADELYSKFRNWGNRGDGSLNAGGREIISPPLGGDKIEQVAHVYNLLKRHNVNMTDQAAGCHIHVDFQDVREVMNNEWKRECGGSGIKIEARRNTFIAWGNTMTRAVRCMVEHSRTQNTYCKYPFGARNYYEEGNALRGKLRETGYASIAVREKTLEFRIWSVTGDPELSLARLEFSQKAVEYLRKMVSAVPSAHSAYRKRLDRAADMVAVGKLAPMARLFRLTKGTVEKLQPFVTRSAMERGHSLAAAI